MSSAPKRPKQPDVTFVWTSIADDRAAGLDDLLISHWAEVEDFQKELPLDIDWPKYLHLERAGVYRAVGAWRGAKLIGYNAFFVQPSMQYRGVIWANNDVLYLDPEERKGNLGTKLIKISEMMLKPLGVRCVLYEATTYFARGKAGATLSTLLDRSGYRHTANVHMKLL